MTQNVLVYIFFIPGLIVNEPPLSYRGCYRKLEFPNDYNSFRLVCRQLTEFNSFYSIIVFVYVMESLINAQNKLPSPFFFLLFFFYWHSTKKKKPSSTEYIQIFNFLKCMTHFFAVLCWI